jgi:hypothetical protein
MDDPKGVLSPMYLSSKDWKSFFGVQRDGNPPKEVAWVQTIRKYNKLATAWEIFWEKDGDGRSTHLPELVRTFCQRVSLNDLESPNQPCPPVNRSASVDGYGSDPIKSLSAPELYQLLLPKVYKITC